MKTALIIGLSIALTPTLCTTRAFAQTQINLNAAEQKYDNIDNVNWRFGGKVDKLVFNKITGGCTIDLRGLAVREIVVIGRIDDKSKVFIKQADFIKFENRVGARSEVYVDRCRVFEGREVWDDGTKLIVNYTEKGSWKGTDGHGNPIVHIQQVK